MFSVDIDLSEGDTYQRKILVKSEQMTKFCQDSWTAFALLSGALDILK